MQIVPFRPDLTPAFAALNLEWIERLFALEPADLAVLRDPQAAIIAPGGAIFLALDGEAAVGTVAAIAAGPARYELAKMAVTPAYQGRGLGEALGRTVIHWARERGAETVFLLTNSRLTGAIRLYERLGFEHRPLPGHTEYHRADVYMELALTVAGAGGAA
ncbi:MAG TPA: GNAT family N-acetyltransferase [Gemmatimonadales bacterium]|nr:GNAT family N-acetyltransferase [Gemmatimonadales bacterium]